MNGVAEPKDDDQADGDATGASMAGSAAHDAFMSYSRRDKEFATALEAALESFHPPRDLQVPQRRLNVFRDEGDFTGVDYYKAVDDHLRQARKLIVVCSPAARASRFVDDEIQRFLAGHDAAQLVPVIVDGLPNNECTGEDDPRCAFPRALTLALAMPLAADWRGINLKRERVDRGSHATPWFSLLANLYGVSRAEIEQRELRRQTRRRRLVAGGAGAIIVVLLVALAVSLVYRAQALEQAGIAEHRREEAEKQTLIATNAATQERAARERETEALRVQERLRGEAEASLAEAQKQQRMAQAEAVTARRETATRLSVQAVESLQGAPNRALTLAGQAIDIFHARGDPPVAAALGAMLKAQFSAQAGMPVAGAGPGVRAMSSDLQWTARVDARGELQVGRVLGTALATLPWPDPGPGQAWASAPPVFAIGSNVLVAARKLGPAGQPNAAQWVVAWPLNAAGAGAVRVLHRASQRDAADVGRLEVSPDGQWLAWRDARGQVILRALADGAAPAQLACASRCELLFSADSAKFVTCAEDNTLRRFALDSRRGVATALPAVEAPCNAAVQFALGRNRLAMLLPSGEAVWFDIAQSSPSGHGLPSVLPAVASRLELSDLGPALTRTTLKWSPYDDALLVTAVHVEEEFGIAAVHRLKPGAPWRPLWHRYDGRAMTQSSQADKSGRYAIRDGGDLGVRSAQWVRSGVATLGFEGSIWYRSTDEDAPDRFQLISRDATAMTAWRGFFVVGRRDGRLHFWDLGRETPRPWFSVNAFDAEVESFRTAPPRRLVATDRDGAARVWDFDHPLLADTLDIQDSPQYLAYGERWTVTRTQGEGVRLWPRLPGSTSRQLPGMSGFKDSMVAFDRWARWMWRAVAEGPGAPGQTVFRFERWDLDLPEPERAMPQVHRVALSAPTDATGWQLLVDADERHVRLQPLGTRQTHAFHRAESDARFQIWRPRTVNGWKVDEISGSGRWAVLRSVVPGADDDQELSVLAELQEGSLEPLHVLPISRKKDRYHRLSPDGRHARIERDDGSRCLQVLQWPLPACVPLPAEQAPGMDLHFPPAGPPLAWAPEGRVHRWVAAAGRFEPVGPPQSVTSLDFDPRGAWRFEGDSGAVRVFRMDAASPALSLVLPPGMDAARQVSGFMSEGWMFAGDAKGRLAVWQRSPEGHWSLACLLDVEDLNRDWALGEVKLSPDRRFALIARRLVPLEPAGLLADARHLSGGRWR